MLRWLLFGLTLAIGGTLLAAEAPVPARKIPDTLFTPASSLAPALADAKALGDEAHEALYFSLYNELEADLPAVRKALTFVVNSLSDNPVIVPLTPVKDGKGRLFRILLRDYRLKRQAVEDLLEQGSGRVPITPPYFTKPITRGRKRLVALAEHLPTAEALELATLTGTNTPIARADWFCYYATQEPAYHRLIGIDKLDDVFKELAINQADIDRLGVETKGVVARSEVAEYIRALRRNPSIVRRGAGYLWISDDYETSIGRDDLLASADQLINAKPAAHEVIWTAKNGLQKYLVTDGAGQRLDRAAINVARDRRSPFSSPEVEIRNCFCCHGKGLNDIHDEVRLRARGPLALSVEAVRRRDERLAQQILDRFFTTSISDEVAADQDRFAAAVASVNGMAAAGNALALQKILVRFETDLTFEELALETGYPVATIKGVLERSKGIGADHTGLLGLNGARIRRDQWEASGFADVMGLLLGVTKGERPPTVRPPLLPVRKRPEPPRLTPPRGRKP